MLVPPKHLSLHQNRNTVESALVSLGDRRGCTSGKIEVR
jgi:hypothetical protein